MSGVHRVQVVQCGGDVGDAAEEWRIRFKEDTDTEVACGRLVQEGGQVALGLVAAAGPVPGDEKGVNAGSFGLVDMARHRGAVSAGIRLGRQVAEALVAPGAFVVPGVVEGEYEGLGCALRVWTPERACRDGARESYASEHAQGSHEQANAESI